jgi:hypothetical protein
MWMSVSGIPAADRLCARSQKAVSVASHLPAPTAGMAFVMVRSNLKLFRRMKSAILIKGQRYSSR